MEKSFFEKAHRSELALPVLSGSILKWLFQQTAYEELALAECLYKVSECNLKDMVVFLLCSLKKRSFPRTGSWIIRSGVL